MIDRVVHKFDRECYPYTNFFTPKGSGRIDGHIDKASLQVMLNSRRKLAGVA